MCIFSGRRWNVPEQKPLFCAFSSMALFVHRQAAGDQSRLAHLSLLSLNLRLMENWRSLQIATIGEALDCDSTLILMAIITISAERLLRSGLESELKTLKSPLPHDRISKPNLSSIAAATGINRETVRRKVNDLQSAGLVVRDGRGVQTALGGLQLKALEHSIGAQLDAIARTVNQLSKLGVLTSKRH
jgi:hypothetical protein